MSIHAFDAARAGGFRGYFFFPGLEPKKQITAWTRDAVSQKVNWLYNNVDPMRIAVDALTLEEVDTGIWPKAQTSNPAFNRAVTESFHNEVSDPRFFHSAGIENYYTAQWLIRRNIMLHGEHFAQLLRPGDNYSARVHFINAWRIGTATTNLDQSKWVDGVRYDKLGRAQEYRFLDEDRRTFKDIPAEDMMHLHDRFWTDQLRGISPLAPVVNKLYSLDDIERAETSGVLLRTMLAYAIERKEDVGGPSLLPGAVMEEVEQPDGSKLIIQKIVSNDAREVQVADIPAGQTLKVIESNRAASTVEFLKWMLRGVANCSLYPEEYVLNLTGISQGTVARIVQKRVQRVKNTVRQFQLIPQFCVPFYRFWLWQKIKSGAFDAIPGGIPEDWYRAKHICPADDSVDIAREGKLFDERLATGNMSPADYHGMMGTDEEDVTDEVIATRISRLRKLQAAREANPDLAEELSYEATFPNKLAPAEAAVPPSAPEQDPEDDPEDNPNTPDPADL